MAERIRALDWASTPLGPIARWPQSLKTIVDLMLGSPGMMSLVWGPEAIHLYNDSFTELLREHRLQALGRSAYENFARSRDVFEADLAAGMAGRSARLLAQRYPVLRQGHLAEAWFDVDYAPIRDEAGAVAGVLWTLKETTAQHLAEQTLRASEARHRLLIGSWAQAVWEVDADGVVVADSPSWRAYTGQTREEWLGYGWLDAIHPDDRAHAERQWREAIAARAPIDVEFRLRAPDRGWRWTNVRAAAVRDAAGRIEKWAGMNIDIDARKGAEAALRESEERQAFYLQLSDALASLMDPGHVQAEATRRLAERIHADRCYFLEFDDRQTHASVMCDGLPAMAGVHDLSGEPAFLDLVRSGRVLDMPDMTSSEHFSAKAKATYGELGIRSAVGAPILRNGCLVAVLLAADTRVRSWTQGDVELMKGAAERIWEALQRARAEEAVRQNGERLRRVLDGMTEGFGLIAPDFTILEHNAEALRLDGRSYDEVVGRSHWDAYPGSEDSELGRLLKRGMAERVPVSLEHSYVWENGRVLWLDMRGYPTADGALAVFWRDVTDRKQVETTLRESEEKYRSLFESMDEAYAVVEVLKDEAGSWVDFRFVEVNPAFLKHTSMPWPVGRTATELLGRPNPRWTELYGQALDTGEPIRVEESEPTLDRVFDLNIFALDRGRNRIAVLFTDISVAKRAEAALRGSEERFRALFAASPVPFAELSPNPPAFTITAANDAYLAAAMTTREQFVGRPMFDALPDDPSRPGTRGPALLAASLNRVLATRRTDVMARIRYDPQMPNGEFEPSWWLPVNAPILDASGEVSSIIHQATRVTELQLAEEAERARQARQAFLLKLSDRLREEADPRGIALTAVSLLATHMRLDRACVAEVDKPGGCAAIGPEYRHPDLAPVEGVLALSDFPEAFTRVEASTLVLSDTSDDPTLSDSDRLGFAALRMGALIVASARRGEHNPVWAMLVATVERRQWTAVDVATVEEVVERTWAAIERARTEAALRESEERFAQFATSSSDGLWIRDAATLAMEYTSPAIETIYGVPPDDLLDEMERWVAVILPDDRENAISHIERARSGASVTHEFRIRRPSDGALRWIRNTDFPLRDGNGQIQRIGGIAQDVTDAKRASERQDVLIAELQHRTRNLIAVVKGIASDTMQETDSTEAFRAAFSDRLLALSRVQSLLSRSEVEPITIGALLRLELDALGAGVAGDRVTLAGPEVFLRPSTVQTLALALHELATNARKYGALSHEGGYLAVTWRKRFEADQCRLVIEWIETGLEQALDQPASERTGGGYGRELIEQALPHALGARTSYALSASGVRCTIDLAVRPGKSGS